MRGAGRSKLIFKLEIEKTMTADPALDNETSAVRLWVVLWKAAHAIERNAKKHCWPELGALRFRRFGNSLAQRSTAGEPDWQANLFGKRLHYGRR